MGLKSLICPWVGDVRAIFIWSSLKQLAYELEVSQLTRRAVLALIESPLFGAV